MSGQSQSDIASKIKRLQELEQRQQMKRKRIPGGKKRKKEWKNIGIILIIVLILFACSQMVYIAGQYYMLKRQINIMDDRLNQIASKMRVQDKVNELPAGKNTEKNGEN